MILIVSECNNAFFDFCDYEKMSMIVQEKYRVILAIQFANYKDMWR